MRYDFQNIEKKMARTMEKEATVTIKANK